MKIFELVKSLRCWSLAFGATSFIPLAYVMYQNWLFSQWAKEQAANGAFICGTGMVALLSVCVVMGAALSAVGSLLGLIGYFKSGKPRPKTRIVEIAVVSTIMIVTIAAAFLLI